MKLKEYYEIVKKATKNNPDAEVFVWDTAREEVSCEDIDPELGYMNGRDWIEDNDIGDVFLVN